MRTRLARLLKLEEAARALGAGTCQRCYGTPVALIHEEEEPDPHGPGYRRTGRRWVEPADLARVTDDPDDCRCRFCGARAVRMIVTVLAGIDPLPGGRGS